MLKQKIILFDFSGTIVNMRPAKLLVNKNLLAKMAINCILGIVTGARRTETLNILKKLKVSKFFEIIITKDDSKFSKPDTRTINKIKNIYKVKIYIGDTKKDECFAKNINVSFFRVNKRYNINKILKDII